LRFIVNVVQDDQKRVAYVRAGEPEAAFRELVAFAKTLYEVPVPKQYDVAVAGVGFPKDANLYQASRAASYLFFAPTPVVKPGGVFIVPAPCGEGAGEGVGEQRFLKAMQDAPDVQFILDDARQHGYPPGQQRAFVMAKVLEQSEVIFVGAEDPALVASAKFSVAPTMEAAFKIASNRLGSSLDALIVPHALLTLPIVQGN
jgi:nickel-dependent lactate racemase